MVVLTGLSKRRRDICWLYSPRVNRFEGKGKGFGICSCKVHGQTTTCCCLYLFLSLWIYLLFALLFFYFEISYIAIIYSEFLFKALSAHYCLHFHLLASYYYFIHPCYSFDASSIPIMHFLVSFIPFLIPIHPLLCDAALVYGIKYSFIFFFMCNHSPFSLYTSSSTSNMYHVF